MRNYFASLAWRALARPLSLRAVGGLVFWRVGRLGGSVYLARSPSGTGAAARAALYAEANAAAEAWSRLLGARLAYWREPFHDEIERRARFEPIYGSDGAGERSYWRRVARIRSELLRGDA